MLEQITGQSLADYMHHHIFDRLDMDSTMFNISTITDGAERLVDFAVPSSDDPNVLIPGTSWGPKSPFSIYSGGAGLSTTTSDYAKFLQATLRGDLLDKSMRELIFKPQLTNTERKALNKLATNNWDALMPALYPRGAPIDHSLGGIVSLKDSPVGRKKGSVMWYGAVNSWWWIDRETGIAAVMTTQIDGAPNHPATLRLLKELEQAVYQHLLV